MILLMTPFTESPTQRFNITSHRRVHLSKVSVWIYAHNIGNSHQFRFNLIKEKTSDVIATKTLTGSQIKTLCGVTLNYFHGKLQIDFGYDILLNKGHFKVVCDQLTGYSSTTFMGLCRDWESSFGNIVPASTEVWNTPFFMRLYDRKGVEI